MAVVMYRAGETVSIDPTDIAGHLALGFSLEDPNAPPPAGLRYINRGKPMPTYSHGLRKDARVHQSPGHQSSL